MENQMKFVLFDIYCPRCKHRDMNENQHPCCNCMEVPVRENTHVPECWEGESQR